MKQRFLSIFIAVTLMASVLAGAMSVSLRYAKADVPSSYGIGYFGDLALEARESCPATRLVYFDALCAYVGEHFDNSFVVVIHDENTSNWYFGVYTFDTNTPSVKWGFVDSNYNRVKALASNNYTYNFYCQYAVSWTSNSSSVVSNPPKYIDYAYAGVSYGSSQMYVVPSPTDTAVNGRLCYANQALIAWNGGLWDSYWTPNLLNGYAPPQYILFDVVVFYVGERKYFTFLQQDIFRDLMPDHMDYMVGIFADGSDESIFFTWDDVTLLANAENFINQPFTNVSPAGIYAVDVSNYNWVVLDMVNLIEFDEDFNSSFAGYADNCPYRIVGEPGTNGQPDSYTQVFNYFTEYANNYNRTHYIPENLADTLFGLNGSRLYPCEVSVPVAVWNANTTGGSSFADSHNWKWWFPSRDNYGINFELMDVVIVTEPYNDRYSLLYYYSDSLNVPFQFIQNMTFDELLEEFDCIIIVPDDLNMLDGNVWWKNLLTDICNFLGISDLTSNLLTSLAMSGSDSNGVEYVTERPDEVPGTLQGFCIVTKKAIQRQQLYVFNEGITKTYELMSNYLDERGKWEDSFFEWTLSLFYQWQTLDGHLGDIYNLLFNWSSLLENISQKLDQIAENTSEDDPGFWFISFYNWVKRWEPSNLDFANWVDSWDDFTDDLPDPGSGVTVIPLPTSIPTSAVAGG